jgi:4'-phosphopantetheinyl transferase
MAVDILAAAGSQEPATWPLSYDWTELGQSEVHVWRLLLDLPAIYTDTVRSTLSSDEQARAERFHFQKDRNHYIVARGLLRNILSSYLGIGAGDVQFSYSRFGKPALVERYGRQSVQFNLSHSNGLAIVGVTRGRAIGIDLEHIRSNIAYEQMARLFFSPREVETLFNLPPEEQCNAFFTCWTRKEAYIKARGDGLSLDLHKFDVSLSPGESAALLNVADDPTEVARWSLVDVSPEPGYAASLAVEGHECRITLRDLPATLSSL